LLETLQNKNNLIAIVGASNDPKKYGNKILLDLISKGYNVAPVNINEDTIAGIKSYKNVLNLKESPSIINFVVPPSIGLQITKELVKNNFDNFWYQTGAESKEISSFLREKNKSFIDDKCIMVETRY
tara:strand:- start:2350 stop:2730 length:381 start_codon:yes stop_codon:yes gene_type:complete